ncbi:MAG: SH3 domain-containing protein [Hyphomonadaceae bacterium]|nr:SH3 domain-containing protein [Hyphomonadaceae bacterium]
MLRRLVAIGSLLFVTGAAAQPSPLSGDAIREMVAGAVIEVDTPLGTRLPVHLSEDGRLKGEARGLAYILGAPSDIGRWWIAADRLCQRWTRWFGGVVQCLRLSRDGARVFWRRDDGETGTASIITPPPSIAKAPDRVAPTPEREAPEAHALRANAAAGPRAEVPAPVRPDAAPTPSAAAEPAANRPPASPQRMVERPLEGPPQAVAKPADNTQPALAPRAALPAKSHEASNHAPNPAGAARRAQPFRVAGVASHDVLNVRDGPAADYTVIGAILPDAAGVWIVGRCLSEWCPIRHRGMTGWVNSSYLIQDTSVRGLEHARRGTSLDDRP